MAFISAIDDPTSGTRALDKVTAPKKDGGRNYRGFNFFDAKDLDVMLAVVRGEHFISGFRHADLKQKLPGLSAGQISRHIKRMRVHGLIKRVGRRYKYYLTDLGRRAIISGLKLRQLFVLPQLATG